MSKRPKKERFLVWLFGRCDYWHDQAVQNTFVHGPETRCCKWKNHEGKHYLNMRINDVET